jgi:integrase
MVKVKVENNNGSIRLRFQHNKNRYCFSPITSARYNDPEDLALASAIATIISADIKYQRFDNTLIKYKTVLLQEFNEPAKSSSNLTKEEFLATWDKYVTYKLHAGLSSSTISIDYGRRMNNVLSKIKDDYLLDFNKLYSWLIGGHSVESVRRILVQLNACFTWANSEYKAEFRDLLNRHQQSIKATRKRKRPEDDINPFTAAERDQVIELFSLDEYYSFYTPLVMFLFLVGCRPSEALALTWDDCNLDVDKPKVIFNKAYVECRVQPHLKTQQWRSIYLTSKVSNLLIEKQATARGSLVFCAPTSCSKYINWANFTRRAWASILEKLPAIEYRNPYQMRHTYITLAIQRGELVKDVATYCGTSPNMIMHSYAGATREYVPPNY